VPPASSKTPFYNPREEVRAGLGDNHLNFQNRFMRLKALGGYSTKPPPKIKQQRHFSWEQMYQKLTNYIRISGNDIAEIQCPELKKWVGWQRQKYLKYKAGKSGMRKNRDIHDHRLKCLEATGVLSSQFGGGGKIEPNSSPPLVEKTMTEEKRENQTVHHGIDSPKLWEVNSIQSYTSSDQIVGSRGQNLSFDSTEEQEEEEDEEEQQQSRQPYTSIENVLNYPHGISRSYRNFGQLPQYPPPPTITNNGCSYHGQYAYTYLHYCMPTTTSRKLIEQASPIMIREYDYYQEKNSSQRLEDSSYDIANRIISQRNLTSGYNNYYYDNHHENYCGLLVNCNRRYHNYHDEYQYQNILLQQQQYYGKYCNNGESRNENSSGREL